MSKILYHIYSRYAENMNGLKYHSLWNFILFLIVTINQGLCLSRNEIFVEKSYLV